MNPKSNPNLKSLFQYVSCFNLILFFSFSLFLFIYFSFSLFIYFSISFFLSIHPPGYDHLLFGFFDMEDYSVTPEVNTSISRYFQGSKLYSQQESRLVWTSKDEIMCIYTFRHSGNQAAKKWAQMYAIGKENATTKGVCVYVFAAYVCVCVYVYVYVFVCVCVFYLSVSLCVCISMCLYAFLSIWMSINCLLFSLCLSPSLSLSLFNSLFISL